MAFLLLTKVTRWRRWGLCDVKYSAACSSVLVLVTVVINPRYSCYVTAQGVSSTGIEHVVNRVVYCATGTEIYISAG
jgi:hypothetical protein